MTRSLRAATQIWRRHHLGRSEVIDDFNCLRGHAHSGERTRRVAVLTVRVGGAFAVSAAVCRDLGLLPRRVDTQDSGAKRGQKHIVIWRRSVQCRSCFVPQPSRPLSDTVSVTRIFDRYAATAEFRYGMVADNLAMHLHAVRGLAILDAPLPALLNRDGEGQPAWDFIDRVGSVAFTVTGPPQRDCPRDQL
jgi:hypothetical protein